jgi:hypothetical protein
MLFLNPHTVTLGAVVLDRVSAIIVDRTADRLALEYSDAGAYPIYADVPEQRVTVTIVRDLLEGDPLILSSMVPGYQVTLAFATSPADSEAQLMNYSASLVITAVKHELKRGKSAIQRIVGVAIATSGNLDPFTPPSAGKQ